MTSSAARRAAVAERGLLPAAHLVDVPRFDDLCQGFGIEALPSTASSAVEQPPPVVFAGDTVARLYDLGVPYGHLTDWLRHNAHHRWPLLWEGVYVYNGDSGDVTPVHLDADMPVSMRLGLLRCDHETEREHLVRAGDQVALAAVRPGPPVSIAPLTRGCFPPGVPPLATEAFPSEDLVRELIAELPVPLERFALAELANHACSVRVLRTLARDPEPRVRASVVYRVSTDRAADVLDVLSDPAAPESDPTVLIAVLYAEQLPFEVVEKIIARAPQLPVSPADLLVDWWRRPDPRFRRQAKSWTDSSWMPPATPSPTSDV